MYHGGGGGYGGGFHLHGAFDEDEMLGKVYDSRIVGRMYRYLRPVKTWLALGAGGMLLRTLAQLATPYLIVIATGRFIQTKDLAGLNIIVILFIGATLLAWAGQYMQTLFLSYAGESILLRMRTEMFDHLQKLSLSFFDRNQVGKLMSRVQNDVQQLQELVTNGVLNIITSALTLVGIAVIMILLNARLALLTLTVVPALAIVTLIWQKYARRAFIRVRQAIATVNAQLQEGISGVRVTQSLSREGVNFERFDNVNRAHLDANVDAARLEALMMPAVQVLTAIAFSLILVFGGYQVLDGTMGAEIIIGFLLYIQRFFDPILELTTQYTELQRSMASGARIFELLDVKPEIEDNPRAMVMPPVKGEVRFQGVSFSYQPGIEVLHDIDLAVKPGEMVAIAGRTGAGKSSLMNLVLRFYEAEKGDVTIDGYNVNAVTQQSLRQQIGIVPQDPFLFSGSIEDNIKYGRMEATHDEVINAAKTVGAHSFITHLKHGYDTLVGERGGNLSAGQRQFVCLARAVLADPPIIILDEATSSVDTNAERLMQESFRRLMQGRTCLVIAHRLSTVTNADRIIVLERGRITEMGSHRELLAKEGLYANMFKALSTAD
ncbi:MAG: ABC transporter ATP-binding protein [Dehalococcoidales bacterium]|nr:ABC transporter ATP-binding protein [Dehalococcoidales bacterium]